MVTERVDGRPLYLFRILFGALMFASMVRFWSKGWIEDLYLRPAAHFTYWGFGWVTVWPAPWLQLHFALVALAAVAVGLGLYFRFSAALFFLSFTWLELLDVTYYLNHYYLISLLALLMIFLPLGDGWSIDALLKKRSQLGVPAWSVYLLRAQVGLVYFFAGVAKLKGDWLLRAEPLGTWLRANQDFPLVGRWFGEPAVAYFASWSGALFDLAVVPLLLWRRTRWLAYVALLVFHLVTAKLFQLGMFPWIMMMASLVFLPARSLGGVGPLPRWGAILAGAHLSLQLLIPLRHLLYPGQVLWHEQGFRWAWHVMLVEKAGYAVFSVRDPESGREWSVYPKEYLTSQQQKVMSTQPDLILQLAHRIADDYRAKGIAAPEVRADVWVSYNGRRSQRLIDPTVDLAKERDGLWPKRWIQPPQS